MLRVWILNVGHGDSIIIENHGADGPAFGVIDSNHIGDGPPKALSKLQELGAEELSFVALTHPHKDHYMGLSQVMEYYSGRISQFYSFPMNHHVRSKFEALVKTYQKFVAATDSQAATRGALEYIKTLCLARNTIGLDNWHELAGNSNRIMPPGFADAEIIGLLPPAKAKGYYFQMIAENDLALIDGRQDENKLSLAFLIRYRNRELILGGDGTHANWIDHRRQWHRGNAELNAVAVKLPHHGSKHDCSADVFDYMFASGDTEKVAIISADGQSHPPSETYSALAAAGIKPYCTNLAYQCGANIQRLISLPDAAPVLRRMINSAGQIEAGVRQPCQGDIMLQIDDDGTFSVASEHNLPCPYRGGYDALVV